MTYRIFCAQHKTPAKVVLCLLRLRSDSANFRQPLCQPDTLRSVYTARMNHVNPLAVGGPSRTCTGISRVSSWRLTVSR